MGWIGDTLKALLGFDEEESAYRRTLANAERYVTWGCREDSRRDLEHALKLLAECPPEKAPNSHYAYRRQRAAAEANVHLARLTVQGLRSRASKLQEHFEAIEEGRRNLLSQTEALGKRVAELEAEGSLISAREERRRLEEMEREIRELPDIDTGKASRRTKAFSSTAPRYRKYRDGVNRHLAALRALEGLAAGDVEIRDKICSHMEKTLSQLDGEWKKLAAEFKETPPAGGSRQKPAE